MSDKIIIDTKHYHDSTLGRLTCGDFQCFTLELPWINNKRNVSCIPAGTYPAIKYKSPRHGTVILLENVPDRSMIEIHSGNYTRQIEGCILVGDSIRFLDNDPVPDVTNSRNTLAKLLRELPSELTVEIVR